MRNAACIIVMLLTAASLAAADPPAGTMIVSLGSGGCGLSLVSPLRYHEILINADDSGLWLRSTETAAQTFAPLPGGGIVRVPALNRLAIDSNPLPETNEGLGTLRRPAVDGNGNIYLVKQPGLENQPFRIVRYTSTGQHDADYDVPTLNGTVSAIELAADGCTLFLAVARPESSSIARYDLCRRELLPDFAPLKAQALRALRDGTLLASHDWSIIRLDANGAVVRTYALPPPNPMGDSTSRTGVIALIPDETAVWIGEKRVCSSYSRLFLMRLSDGAIEREKRFLSYTEVADIALFGEQRVTFVPTPPARSRAARRR